MNDAEIPSSVDPACREIVRRAIVHAVHMIHSANHREDRRRGDPKVGGHPAASTSAAHILGALHLAVREPEDVLAIKPHASPIDHAFHHLLGLFRDSRRRWMEPAEREAAMDNLRRFPSQGEPVFQSYHAASDPDHQNLIPTGSVGIPPVACASLALAYRLARRRGFDVPDTAHFWSVLGDSEFREGSLTECLPEIGERELGNVTWICDYNRQSLDGTRDGNVRALPGGDAVRLEGQAVANGWEVIQLRHGSFRRSLFEKSGGDRLRQAMEGISDHAYQVALLSRDADRVRRLVAGDDKHLAAVLDELSDHQILHLLADVGGHDIEALVEAMRASRSDSERPTLIIAHTIKGFALECFAAPGNHSALPSREEVDRLLASQDLDASRPYALFDDDSDPARFLLERGASLREGLDRALERRSRNLLEFSSSLDKRLPSTFEIDIRLYPRLSTQAMFGQLTARLVRAGMTEALQAAGRDAAPLGDIEKAWQPIGRYALTLSPDVGTSTNIGAAMDGKVFGPEGEEDLSSAWGVGDPRRPDLHASEEQFGAHVRFDIAEANAMTAMGAFGKMGDLVGVPFLPVMTVYDFFIKRALDQLYYDLYWRSSFILVGTPSGVALSPEGAQHSWKSDIQMPNLVTWEPAFGIEVDWIFADAVRRHAEGENTGRSGVLIRASTLELEQEEMLRRLKQQSRFADVQDDGILEAIREDVLQGGYRLVCRRDDGDYSPGDNVVHIVAMGPMVPEALAASDALLERGVAADVVVVTSPDLLLGILGHENGYRHLQEDLGIDGALHLGTDPRHADADDLLTASGGRIPVVSVADGEAGLLDNIGSIAGTRQISLGVRRFSKSGTPRDVFEWQKMDASHIEEAAMNALADTALDPIHIHPDALAEWERARAVKTRRDDIIS